ncbi:MAG: c-type cytochrome domain-containing protein [Planctomycetota bacterium]
MKSRALLFLLLAFVVISGLEQSTAGSSPFTGEDQLGSAVDFDLDVRPILARYCLPCHGNDGEARKKNLRLDDEVSATALLDRKHSPITPGDPQSSLALLRILDDDDPMPPDGRKRPSAEEVETLRR